MKHGIYELIKTILHWENRIFTKWCCHFTPPCSRFADVMRFSENPVVKTDPSPASWCCPEMMLHLRICSSHSSNSQRSIQNTDSSTSLQLLLTYFHLQGWGFVVNSDRLPLPGIGVRLWGRGRRWVLGVDSKVRRCRQSIIHTVFFLLFKLHNRGYLCPTMWMKPVGE